MIIARSAAPGRPAGMASAVNKLTPEARWLSHPSR